MAAWRARPAMWGARYSRKPAQRELLHAVARRLFDNQSSSKISYEKTTNGRRRMTDTPKIKHLAIITLDPERLANFYEKVFGMRRLVRPADRPKTGSKAVFMTDGYLTLALLENKAEGKPPGLNHFGFQISDQQEIADRLVEFGLAPTQRPADRPYAETRATDPDGNNYDMAVRGFGA